VKRRPAARLERVTASTSYKAGLSFEVLEVVG
jgi:hypothetical protein